MFSLLFDTIPKIGLLLVVPAALIALVAGVLLIVAGQWALGIVLLGVAAGLGFLVFKLWQLLQPAD